MVSDHFVLKYGQKHKELPRYSILREFVFILAGSNGFNIRNNGWTIEIISY